MSWSFLLLSSRLEPPYSRAHLAARSTPARGEIEALKSNDSNVSTVLRWDISNGGRIPQNLDMGTGPGDELY